MEPVTELLFEPLPRFVANPRQWLVYDEESFDLFKQHNDGSADCYSRISWINTQGEYELDRVFLDLDAEIDGSITDSEMVTSLHASKSNAEDLLDRVVADVRSIADLLYEESIPAVGIYTGKGVHIHALYEPRVDPKEELRSQTNWILDQADVDTFDRQVHGDTKRLCRVPNCRRYDSRLDKPTDLFTVPLERREMRDITAGELAEWSKQPRSIELPGESRPPLLTHPDYQVDDRAEQSVDVESKSVGTYNGSYVDKDVEKWIQSILKLPCLAERIVTRNPSHHVRLGAGIVLLNQGLTINEIVDVFRQLNWADWSAEVTRKQLKSIKREGYSEMSCAKLQSKGLCLWSPNERGEECDHYGFRGGQLTYK